MTQPGTRFLRERVCLCMSAREQGFGGKSPSDVQEKGRSFRKSPLRGSHIHSSPEYSKN